MHNTRILIGSILALSGILLIIHNFELVVIDWQQVLQSWPLAIALLGVSFFTNDRRVLWGLLGMSGLLLTVMVIGFLFYT